MFNDQKKYLQFVYITSDLICLAILYFFIISLFTSSTNGYFFSILSKPIIGNYCYKECLFLVLFLGFLFIPVVLMVVFKVYQSIDGPKSQKVYYQSIVLCTIVIGIVFLSLLFFDVPLKENAYFSFISGLILLLMLAFNRIYIFHFIKKSSSNHNIVKHLLLVGTGFNAQAISSYIENHPEKGLRVTGFLTNKDDEIGKMILNKKILGKTDNLNKIVNELYIDCVVYTGDYKSTRYHKSLIKSCSIMGIDFATTELKLNNKIIKVTNNKRIFSEHIGNIELKIVKFVYISPEASFLKRVFDFTASSILVVLCLPLWVVISITIKLTSQGPVLFRQERIGKYGKKFILFKFRSMVAGAEKMQESLMHLNEMDGPAFKIKHDPRQTIAGKFLRQTSLDELPQLFNVIKGDISLVGPRPAIKKEVICYSPFERKRLSVMQGITCIWQISGRNKIKFDEWMKLDLMYVETRSSSQDFKILFKTIPAVLLKKGAR